MDHLVDVIELGKFPHPRRDDVEVLKSPAIYVQDVLTSPVFSHLLTGQMRDEQQDGTSSHAEQKLQTGQHDLDDEYDTLAKEKFMVQEYPLPLDPNPRSSNSNEKRTQKFRRVEIHCGGKCETIIVRDVTVNLSKLPLAKIQRIQTEAKSSIINSSTTPVGSADGSQEIKQSESPKTETKSRLQEVDIFGFDISPSSTTSSNSDKSPKKHLNKKSSKPVSPGKFGSPLSENKGPRAPGMDLAIVNSSEAEIRGVPESSQGGSQIPSKMKSNSKRTSSPVLLSKHDAEYDTLPNEKFVVQEHPFPLDPNTRSSTSNEKSTPQKFRKVDIYCGGKCETIIVRDVTVNLIKLPLAKIQKIQAEAKSSVINSSTAPVGIGRTGGSQEIKQSEIPKTKTKSRLQEVDIFGFDVSPSSTTSSNSHKSPKKYFKKKSSKPVSPGKFGWPLSENKGPSEPGMDLAIVDNSEAEIQGVPESSQGGSQIPSEMKSNSRRANSPIHDGETNKEKMLPIYLSEHCPENWLNAVHLVTVNPFTDMPIDLLNSKVAENETHEDEQQIVAEVVAGSKTITEMANQTVSPLSLENILDVHSQGLPRDDGALTPSVSTSPNLFNWILDDEGDILLQSDPVPPQGLAKTQLDLEVECDALKSEKLSLLFEPNPCPSTSSQELTFEEIRNGTVSCGPKSGNGTLIVHDVKVKLKRLSLKRIEKIKRRMKRRTLDLKIYNEYLTKHRGSTDSTPEKPGKSPGTKSWLQEVDIFGSAIRSPNKSPTEQTITKPVSPRKRGRPLGSTKSSKTSAMDLNNQQKLKQPSPAVNSKSLYHTLPTKEKRQKQSLAAVNLLEHSPEARLRLEQILNPKPLTDMPRIPRKSGMANNVSNQHQVLIEALGTAPITSISTATATEDEVLGGPSSLSLDALIDIHFQDLPKDAVQAAAAPDCHTSIQTIPVIPEVDLEYFFGPCAPNNSNEKIQFYAGADEAGTNAGTIELSPGAPHDADDLDILDIGMDLGYEELF